MASSFQKLKEFLRDLLNYTHLISRPECFCQIYVIYTYASYEFTILSMMAYDRYRYTTTAP
ncbi:hypothetical protein CRUP_008344 [Coryphaenoides rupestris]|nr:hypothetical protein CRUP_008344 [Coryphaenoides rupestris]